MKNEGYSPTMFQRRSNIHPSARIDYDLNWMLLICVVLFIGVPLFVVVMS